MRLNSAILDQPSAHSLRKSILVRFIFRVGVLCIFLIIYSYLNDRLLCECDSCNFDLTDCICFLLNAITLFYIENCDCQVRVVKFYCEENKEMY